MITAVPAVALVPGPQQYPIPLFLYRTPKYTSIMLLLLEKLKEDPTYFRQLAVDDQLISEYNCPLETPRQVVLATQSYFVYVLEGKKIWHLPQASFEMTPGKCIFVRKGVHIVEQFFDQPFCFVIFFVSDAFIADTVRDVAATIPVPQMAGDAFPIESIYADDALHGFFHSVVPYFLQHTAPNKKLLELKFRELILNVVQHPDNARITRHFLSLLHLSPSDRMHQIMEDNFYHNLRLDEYARLCGKSLSAFKRDFELYFKTTPGRWLLSRRLQHAHLLVHTTDMTMSEIAFESGFENVSHFSRAFKEQYGHAPTRLRQAV